MGHLTILPSLECVLKRAIVSQENVPVIDCWKDDLQKDEEQHSIESHLTWSLSLGITLNGVVGERSGTQTVNFVK